MQNSDKGSKGSKVVKRPEISDEFIGNLNTVRKWTLFLAIFGFCFLGLLLLFALGGAIIIVAGGQPATGILSFIAYFIMAVIMYFPMKFLLKYSVSCRQVVEKGKSKDLDESSRNLKAFFTYAGVMGIVYIALIIAALILYLLGIGLK